MSSLVGDTSQTDTELVLVNTVQNIGVTYRDTNGNPLIPDAISLVINDLNGSTILTDIYSPASQRMPDPPRILNPSTGRYEFPFGLDNGSTNPLAKNKTSCVGDYLFNWRASETSAVYASLTLAPLQWTAEIEGTPGNFITIQYINPGSPNQVLSIVRNGAKIEISLATNGVGAIISTANDVITAIQASSEASEIVSVAVASGSLGTDIVPVAAATPLTGGSDATELDTICKNVKIISQRVCSLIGKFRLLIDKTNKLVNSDPTDPCYLGYTNGQLCNYLDWGLQIINSYQPYVAFTLNTFPFGGYDFILLESSLLAGLMSQQLFAVDTDIPQWNDSGNSFVILHSQQLAQYANWLSTRLNTLIPAFKLHHISNGSIHIQAGPNYRLQTLISAAPSGSLFRNVYFKA